MINDQGMIPKPLGYTVIGVAFLISIILVSFLAMGLFDFFANPIVYTFCFGSLVLIVPALMMLGTMYESFVAPAIIWLHLTAGVTLIFFDQIYSPFTVAWAMLILFASMYHRWLGFWLSSISLIGFSVWFIYMNLRILSNLEGGVLSYLLSCALVITITIVMSYLFVAIIQNAHRKNQELQESQRAELFQVTRLNTLLNSISDAVVTLNKYGRVTSQNAAAQVFFDTNESLIGREIDKLLVLHDQNESQVYVRQLINETKSTLFRDDLSSKRDKQARLLSIQLARIRGTFDDSEEYGVVLILRDITKQKSLEQEKDEFISVTSHELRTPVAIAEGSLSNLLLLDDRKADHDKIRGAAEDAHKQIIYLSKMINDLSTLSRAERGVGDVIEEIDVDALVHDLYNRYTAEAEAKNLHLNLDSEGSLPMIKTSRLYLEEILQNFITNSIKYTKEGSVTLGAKMEGDSHIRFFVKDTGIGMSQYDIDHIFNKFYRSEDYRTRETSGTGLGLYVVAKLAHKLNTKVEVESRLDHGSVFSFKIQLQTKTFGGDAPKPTEETPAASKPEEKKEEAPVQGDPTLQPRLNDEPDTEEVKDKDGESKDATENHKEAPKVESALPTPTSTEEILNRKKDESKEEEHPKISHVESAGHKSHVSSSKEADTDKEEDEKEPEEPAKSDEGETESHEEKPVKEKKEADGEPDEKADEMLDDTSSDDDDTDEDESESEEKSDDKESDDDKKRDDIEVADDDETKEDDSKDEDSSDADDEKSDDDDDEPKIIKQERKQIGHD